MKKLNATTTKSEFVQSIHKWLIQTLKRNGHEEYSDCFTIEGSSIICDLPANFFNAYEIPENTRIEMKFVTKKV